jgi:hypothetical protein
MRRCLFLPLFLCLTLSAFVSGERSVAFSQNRGAGGDIGYAKVRVRRTGIRFPRLTRFRDREVMRKVNRQIDQLTGEFGCEGERNSYYKVRSNVDYADKDIFSIYASAEYYCGGAYPTNDANMSLTFDLRTGKQVQFGELFKNYHADKREILRTIFASQVKRSERLIASGKAREQTCEGDPDLFALDNLEGSTFAFNFSRAGLKVQPQWPHVIEACAELVTVPYRDLRRFAAPEGLLARVTR